MSSHISYSFSICNFSVLSFPQKELARSENIVNNLIIGDCLTNPFAQLENLIKKGITMFNVQ